MAYQDSDFGMSADGIFGWLSDMNNGFGTGVLYENIPYEIAQKSAILTMGDGIIFNSEKPEIQKKLDKWYRENNVIEKFRKGEYVASMFGKVIYFLVPSKDGKNVVLTQVKNNYQARVAKINEEEQVAELWNQDSQGDTYVYTKTSITPKNITVEYYTDAESRIGMTSAESQPELQLKKRYVYNNPFGMVPVVEIENKVVNNMWGQTVYNCAPDWLPVMNLIESYNITYRISVVETKANRTRYIGDMTPEDVNRIIAGKQDYKGAQDLMGDAYLNVGFNNIYSHDTQGAGLTISMGDPKLDVYNNRLDYIKTAIFNGAGYSPYKSSDNYQNKADALLQNKLDMETTRNKQERRKEKMYRLFDCVLKFFDTDPFDADGNRLYTFDFINSSITDQTLARQNAQEDLSMGVTSQAEVRAMLYNEPLDVAKKKVQEINKDMIEQNKQWDNAMNPDGDEQGNSPLKNSLDKKDILGGE